MSGQEGTSDNTVKTIRRIKPGDQFGDLTILYDTGNRRNRYVVWKCQCVCGNECLATTSHLINGDKKSCGCMHDTIYRDNLKLVDGTSVTKLETRRNKCNSSNTSGYNGVYPHSNQKGRDGRWTAQIGFQGKKYNLGTYDNVEDAAAAHREAESRIYDNFLEWYHKEYQLCGGVEKKNGEDKN